jgi:hypothetical protein
MRTAIDIPSPLCRVEGKSPSARRIREALPPADRTDTYVHVFDCAALSWCDKRQLRLPTAESRGVLLSFHLSLPCDRASMETNRISSRRTLAWRTSALPSRLLFFRSLLLSLPARAHLQALFREWNARKRRSAPPVFFLYQTKAEVPPAGGADFIPLDTSRSLAPQLVMGS